MASFRFLRHSAMVARRIEKGWCGPAMGHRRLRGTPKLTHFVCSFQKTSLHENNVTTAPGWMVSRLRG
jgi:hypothetical protein